MTSSYRMRYGGVERLPSKLSDFDSERCFLVSSHDDAAIWARFRTPQRPGAAILQLFMRAAGRPLDDFGAIPRPLLSLFR